MAETTTNSQRPNILFIFTDQQRSTTLGCAGVEDVITPHLDQFATQSTRFTNAISNTPVCCPARATLMTGRFPLTHGVISNDIPLRTDLPHLAQLLTADGYRCGYIGKWHLDTEDRGCFIPPGPRRRGFDDFWAVANCNHTYNAAHYYLNDDPEPYWFEGYEPFGQADLAIEYLESRGPTSTENNPFCLFLSFGPPHCPYHTAPAEYHALYQDQELRLFPNVDPNTFVETEGAKWGMCAPNSTMRDIFVGYYAHMSAIDAAFGRIMTALDRLGLSDNTLVVFTSDHGDLLFSHGHGWKGKPWRESVGIPLMIRWPGHVPAGRVTDGPIGFVDFMPTLLGAAGVAAPASLEGSDCGRFIRGDDEAAPANQFALIPCMPFKQSLPSWRGLVTRTHSYITNREGPWLMYNDQVDPYQLTNLVHDPQQAPMRNKLQAALDDWLQRTDDKFESAQELAARYIPNHKHGVAPYHTNKNIQAGIADPSLRRYRPKGQGL